MYGIEPAGFDPAAFDLSDGSPRQPAHWVFAKLFIGHDAEPPALRAERADRLLCRHIAPLFEQWGAQGLCCFFIRYHEHGYHLRLRVHAADDSVREQARQVLHQCLDRLALAGTTWQASTYAPELEKYGGPLGNHWAEQHFQASSTLVLTLLRRVAALPPDERAALRSQLALVLMHATLFGAGLGEQETAGLCRGYYRYWWRDASGAGAPADALEPVYQRQRALLRQCLGRGGAQDAARSAWAAQHGDWQDLLAGWSEQVHRDVAALSALERTGRLLVPDWLPNVGPEELGALAERRCTLLAILPNYLHMLNNRLGVNVGNEGRLAYCLMRHLEDHGRLRARPLGLLLQP
ncbi:MAG TPA: thiopeptide-type bacteriocin biosynthesis protein [Burkholderiaceae bacterium]|nr:thiopeptide-type bacteriocin biosynthesis protein [Burkholderiaceae bacterium]